MFLAPSEPLRALTRRPDSGNGSEGVSEVSRTPISRIRVRLAGCSWSLASFAGCFRAEWPGGGVDRAAIFKLIVLLPEKHRRGDRRRFRAAGASACSSSVAAAVCGHAGSQAQGRRLMA